MTIELTEEQELVREAARSLADGEIAPRAQAMDEATSIFPEVLAALRDLNFFGLSIPAALGGVDVDTLTTCLVIEEISRASAAVGVLLSVHNSLVSFGVAKFGSDEQKSRWLPELAGGRIGGFSQSEPNSGSDPASMISTAVKDGGHYVLNGTKTFVTNGAIGEIFLVMAKTDPAGGAKGVTCFIVEKGTPGFAVGAKEKKLGLRASDTVEFNFSDCRVPAANVLGGEGLGFKIGMSVLDVGRLGVASQAVGISQAALDHALRYATERAAFGRPIADLQAIQWMLADMDVKVAAGRLLTHHAARLRDAGRPFTAAAARAKLYATEESHHVTYMATQIHGGYGFIVDYPVERYYRDARVTEVYEGTSEIQRIVIARELLKTQPAYAARP